MKFWEVVLNFLFVSWCTCVILFIFIPTASKKKGGTKSSSDEENIPSSTRKVTCGGANVTGGASIHQWRDAVWCLGENDEETPSFIETGEGAVGQQAEHLRQTVRVLSLLHVYQPSSLLSLFFYSCGLCLTLTRAPVCVCVCVDLTESRWSHLPGTCWIPLWWWGRPHSSLPALTPGSHASPSSWRIRRSLFHFLLLLLS